MDIADETDIETAQFLKRLPTYSEPNADDTGKKKKKTYADTTTILGFALAICVILLIVMTMLLIFQLRGQTSQSRKKVCHSVECVSLAASMLAKMDLTAKPCDDFYQYACGGAISDPLIPKYATMWGSLQKMAQWTAAVLKQLIEKPGHTYKGVDSMAIKKVKTYFQTCMNNTATDTQSSEQMLMMVKSAGSWSVTSDTVSGTFDKNTWNLEKVLAEVGRYGVSPLFSMHVAHDVKDISKQRIMFTQPGRLTLPYNSYRKASSHSLFVEYFTTVGKLLGGGNQTATVAEDVFQFESSLVQMVHKPSRNKCIFRSLSKYSCVSCCDHTESTVWQRFPYVSQTCIETVMNMWFCLKKQ